MLDIFLWRRSLLGCFLSLFGYCTTTRLIRIYIFSYEHPTMDLNKVMLIWRSTTDVEVKTIESTWSSVVNFTVATNRRYKNKEWQTVEESEYHRCVAYGNAADIIWQYVTKGKRLYVEARLRTRKREDTSWTPRYSTELVVDNFIFLDSKQWGVQWSEDESVDDDLPF